MTNLSGHLRAGLAAAVLLCVCAAASGAPPVEHFTKWPDIGCGRLRGGVGMEAHGN